MIAFLLLSLVSSALAGCTFSKGFNDTTRAGILTRISILNGEKFNLEDNGFTYAVSICGDVSKDDHSFASVTKSKPPSKATPTVLGRYNNTDIISSGDWLMLIYSGGDSIIENGTCNGTQWKSLVYIGCASTQEDDLKMSLVSERTAGCFAVFQLKTKLLCPPSPVSKTTVIFALLVISLICYLVIGIAYRRIMTGAKGLEQIPNYEFWRALFVTPYRLVARNRNRQDEWRGAETGDEPLLSP